VEFYLPKGKWTSWWDDSVISGPGWRREKHGFGRLPLYVREGTVLPLGKETGKDGEGFEYDWLSDGEVRLYQTKTGDKAKIVDPKGKEVADLTVGADGSLNGMESFKRQWQVLTIRDPKA